MHGIVYFYSFHSELGARKNSKSLILHLQVYVHMILISIFSVIARWPIKMEFSAWAVVDINIKINITNIILLLVNDITKF